MRKTESKQNFEELLKNIRSLERKETDYKNDLMGFKWVHYWGKPAAQKHLRGPFECRLMVFFSDHCVPLDEVSPAQFLPPNMLGLQNHNLDIHNNALFLQ